MKKDKVIIEDADKFWKELDEKNRLSENFCKKCWKKHKEIQMKWLAKLYKAGYTLVKYGEKVK